MVEIYRKGYEYYYLLDGKERGGFASKEKAEADAKEMNRAKKASGKKKVATGKAPILEDRYHQLDEKTKLSKPSGRLLNVSDRKGNVKKSEWFDLLKRRRRIDPPKRKGTKTELTPEQKSKYGFRNYSKVAEEAESKRKETRRAIESGDVAFNQLVKPFRVKINQLKNEFNTLFFYFGFNASGVLSEKAKKELAGLNSLFQFWANDRRLSAIRELAPLVHNEILDYANEFIEPFLDLHKKQVEAYSKAGRKSIKEEAVKIYPNQIKGNKNYGSEAVIEILSSIPTLFFALESTGLLGANYNQIRNGNYDVYNKDLMRLFGQKANAYWNSLDIDYGDDEDVV